MEHTPLLTSVREAHRFNEKALAAYLAKHLKQDFADMQVRQFEGGQSNPTFRISTEHTHLVLRKKPPGKLLPSAHAIEREFRVMNALRDSGVPVPQTLLLCEDESVVGTPFFIMTHVPGRVVADPSLPGFSPEERGRLYTHFAEVLAALHGVDYQALGLGDYGKSGNYYARQIARWSKQYTASKTEEIAAVDALMGWLPKNIPDTEETTLVHGDFRLHNCIIHPSEPRIEAILDWELSTLGHPLADLGYSALAYYYLPGQSEGHFPPPGSGIPDIDAYLDSYTGFSGRDPHAHWTFYVVFTLFRLAAIIQGVIKRGMDGNASSARWMEMRDECRKTSERAWRLVETGT